MKSQACADRAVNDAGGAAIFTGSPCQREITTMRWSALANTSLETWPNW
ncbi:MAG TPA: hypothetical protein VF062_19905 [Candidatus Limnocylindrales bacterium]